VEQWPAPSLVLRGTLIAALSLFACTDDFGRRNWKIVHFGQNQRRGAARLLPDAGAAAAGAVRDCLQLKPEDAAWRTPAVAKCAAEMLAAFPYGGDARANRREVRKRAAARAAAESAALSAALETCRIPPDGNVRVVPVEVVSPNEISRMHRCPEAFLMDKAALCRANCEQQRAIGEKLFP
jgi:hypothetical protein